MAVLGREPASTPLTSADIAQGTITLDDISFTDVPANMDIAGTIDKHTMRLADGVTITGDVTISDDLVLAKLSDDGVGITMMNDSSTRTITGSGSIEASTLAQTRNENLTGMTGAIGSAVTGTLGGGITFPAGHVLQVVQGPLNDTNVSCESSTPVASYTTATITNVKAGNNVFITSNTPMRAYQSSGDYVHGNFWLYWYTTGGSYANIMDGDDGTFSNVVYHLARIYFDETTALSAFYHDLMVPINYMHKDLAAGTHYYKIYFNATGGRLQSCWNELPGTMQLMEIQT